jgi:hypothetical protein
MLRRVNAGPDYLGGLLHLCDRDPVDGNRNGCDERSMNDRQRARRLRRDHVLAAIMRLVCRIAGHMVTALHRLLVEGHGIAVRELQKEHYADGHNEGCDLPKHQSVPNGSTFLNSRLVESTGQVSWKAASENALFRG